MQIWNFYLFSAFSESTDYMGRCWRGFALPSAYAGNNVRKISWDFGRKWAVGSKKLAKSLEYSNILPIFAARMRVAYRRDYIKLRNRSSYTEPLVEYLRLLFFYLIRGRAWIENFDSWHYFPSGLQVSINHYCFTIEHNIASSNHPANEVGLSSWDVLCIMHYVTGFAAYTFRCKNYELNKRCRAFDGDELVGDGMCKGELCGMQIHAISGFGTIKWVTKNGHP